MKYRLFLGACLAATLSPVTAFAQDTNSKPEASESNDIIVTARLEKGARLAQQKAINLINVQSAEAIAKYPDYNAAEALSRIPGVSLSIDTGEGRFVNIRGIDGNLNGATFGGAVLLNTYPGGTSFTGSGRAVEFDTIPSGQIDKIVVTKTGLPDHEAEGIGGMVELTPRSALTHPGLFFEGQLGEGYETARTTTNLTEEFAIGNSFGTNRQGDKLFHIVFAQSEHNDGRGFDDIEEGYLDSPGSNTGLGKLEDKVVSTYELRRYRYHRERFGYYSELDVTPDDNTRLYLRASMAGYQERVNRDRILVNGLDGTGTNGSISINPNDPNGFAVTGASLQNTLRDEKETHRNVAVQGGGEHRFGAIKVDWLVSYMKATYDKPYDFGASFNGPGQNGVTAPFAVTYNNIANPSLPLINIPSNIGIADPSQYYLSKIDNSVEYGKDRELSYAINIAFPVGLTSGDEIKLGGKLRYRRKYDLQNGGAEYDTANGGAAGDPTLASLQGDGPFTNFYGHYNIGYQASPSALVALYNQNEPGVIPLSLASPVFDDVEDVAAGYIQYHGTFGKLGVLAGVRFESTKADFTGVISTTDASGNTTNTLTTVHKSYGEAFPTLQLRYDFTRTFIARATYSTGLSRPGFELTALSATVNDQNPPGGDTGVINIGNPNLVPSYSHNFDFDFEYYLPNQGIFSVGFFDKEIDNFIVQRTVNEPYPLIDPKTTDIYQVDTYLNAQNTWVRGVEANFVSKFTFLPGLWKNLGVDSNVTVANSKVVLTDGEPSVRMPGTAPFTANLALLYEDAKVETRLAMKYDGRTIFTIGGSSLQYSYGAIQTNQYLDHRLTLDWTGSYNVNRIFKFYASVKNILDTPLRYYEGNPDRPIQREYYGQTYEAGIKVKF